MTVPNSKHERSSRAWPYRALFAILGLAMIALGLAAIAEGYWWIHSYNPRLGVIGTGPILVLVFIGGLFVLLSLIPWRERREKPRSKDDLYKVP
jgi:hypothetical protein